MLRISHDLQQKPVMHCCSVGWRKGKLLVDQTLTKLTGSVVLTLRDMLPQIQIKVKKVKISHKMLVKCCLVFILTRLHVCKIIHMYQRSSTCFSAGGKAYPHSQMDCRKSKTKNE